MLLWKPDDANIKGNNVLTGEPFSITHGGGAGEGTSECNVISLEHNHMSFDEMKISRDCSEGYFGELADTLFDFTSEEILEDAIDNSYLDGLSSLLLNSPYDANDEMPIIPETKEPVVPVAYPDIVSADLEEKIGVRDSHLCIHKCTTGNQFPIAASILSLQSLEYCNGAICCTLNTEDPEVPSFSDAEAMILDMDLEPDDGDSSCNGQGNWMHCLGSMHASIFSLVRTPLDLSPDWFNHFQG